MLTGGDALAPRRKHHMNRSLAKHVLSSLALCAATASIASAQITDEYVQNLIRAAAERAGVPQGAATQLPPSPTQSVAGQAQPALSLTLDDAIKLALERNLDIQVQRLNPQTFDFSIAAIESVYRPTVISTLGAQSFATASNNIVTGAGAGVPIHQGTATWNGGLSQQFKWGGGSASLTLNNNRQTTDSPTAQYKIQYGPQWSMQYTQPLLRNFKIDNTRQQLAISRVNQDISEIQLQALIINTVSNVRNAYWDYVFATQSVEVSRRSVELAEQLVRDNQTRVEIGTMAPIDVVQAQSQAATQRQNLATAEGTRRTAELTLKRLIVNGTQDPNWTATINPTDRPDFDPTPIDVPSAVRRGLENRTDLQQARKNLEVNDITFSFLQNQTAPQADLVARYGLNGQGGTQIVYEGTGINRIPVGQIPGGYSNALDTLLNSRYPNWNVSVNIGIPLGTSAQQANLARARVQQNQVQAQLKQMELQIATDVTNAAVSVQNNVERVQAAQAARQFAERQLEAEQSKFEVGMSTNYFVVQAQRDLANAQNSELQAVLAYRRSQVELERLQQTTLGGANITILGR
jgi:outer membrane protein TolC